MAVKFSASRLNLPRFRQATAADLCVDTLSVKSDVTNFMVLDLFTKHRELVSLPVIENGRPIGLISRNIFMSQMSKQFHREVYGKKNCIAFMDKEPLIVDADMSIESLTFRAVEFGERALADGFVITRDGVLLGIGFGLELMNVAANMQAEKNRQLMHSIDYASVIQRAMLRPSRDALCEALEDAHLVWQPRDVVGGDFYHFACYQDGWFAAIADCTGHGVPGAFMTLISSSTLVQAVQQHGPRDPAALLSALNRGIKQMLGQTDGRDDAPESDDGMDAAFFWFDNATRNLTFAGAKLTPSNQTENQMRRGSFCIGARGDSFFLLCANPVATENVESMRAKLEPLHSMTMEQIKDAYKKVLRDETPEDSKGAGLGFLTMARDASEPLEFEFVQEAEDPDTTIFCIKAII